MHIGVNCGRIWWKTSKTFGVSLFLWFTIFLFTEGEVIILANIYQAESKQGKYLSLFTEPEAYNCFN